MCFNNAAGRLIRALAGSLRTAILSRRLRLFLTFFRIAAFLLLSPKVGGDPSRSSLSFTGKMEIRSHAAAEPKETEKRVTLR